MSLLACGGEVPAGLQADARIVTDASGLRHIQAATERDLFYLQGYITARDRLWQMELLRRRAWGRRAEVLGEAYYSSDLQSRALGFGRWGELTADLDARVRVPGWTNAWTMPIKTRVDMLATGIRTPVGLKVTGRDLEEIEQTGTALERILKPIRGTRSVVYERNLGGLYVDIIPRRDDLAR